MGNICSRPGSQSEYPDLAKAMAAQRAILPKTLKNYAELEIIRDENQEYSL